MNSPLAPLCVGLLAAVLPSQIDSKNVLVASAGGLAIVDPVAKTSKVVTTTQFSKVAMNHDTPTQLFGQTLHPCVGFATPMDWFVMKGTGISKSYTGCLPFTLYGSVGEVDAYQDKIIFTLSGTGMSAGLYERVPTSTTVKQISSGDARKIAILGDKIYYSIYGAKSDSLFELNMATSPPSGGLITMKLDPKSPKGSVLPKRIATMCAFGPEGVADTLAVFDAAGVLYFVRPHLSGATPNTLTANKKGIAAPVDATYCPHAPLSLVVATSKALYDGLQYGLTTGKAFYTSKSTIFDIDYSGGLIDLYGKGCPGTNKKVPQINANSDPFQGNKNFLISLTDAAAKSAAYLVIGVSKKSWGSVALPFDMKAMGAIGCSLWASTEVTLALGTDAVGGAQLASKIPVSSAYIGATVYTQFGVFDPVNAANLVTTRAMKIVVR